MFGKELQAQIIIDEFEVNIINCCFGSQQLKHAMQRLVYTVYINVYIKFQASFSSLAQEL